MRKANWTSATAMAAALAVGLLAGRFWPEKPVEATATDRYENFAMATGPVDEDTEAVYFLDFLTGELTAAVISPQHGRFNSFYKHNVLADLGIDTTTNPRFLMVTGVCDFRQAPGSARVASSAVYVAELTTGRMVAYTIPWLPERQANVAAPQGPFNFIRLDVLQFRNVVVRDP